MTQFIEAARHERRKVGFRYGNRAAEEIQSSDSLELRLVHPTGEANQHDAAGQRLAYVQL